MRRERQRGNPRSGPRASPLQLPCSMSWYYCLEITSSRVTSLTDCIQLQFRSKGLRRSYANCIFADNLVEEQYEEALASIEVLNIRTLPKPVANDFKVLHQRTKTVLHKLAEFIKICVNGVIGASAGSKRRYHEYVIQVFEYKDNPLTPILACRHIQEILFA